MKQKDISNLKVAIVHDWLVGGGAELVVEELHHMFPDAPIYTSYCTNEWRERLDNKIVTGFLQHWPFSRLRKFLPLLRIWWFTHLDFSEYDLVISSSGNGEAKGIKVPKKALHVSYCHSPTHFYWRHYEDYLREPGFGAFNFLARFGLRLLVLPLRAWDKRAAKRPDIMLANSKHIQADIKKYYGREAIIVHPPVNTSRFKSLHNNKLQSFLTVGRQTAIKHTDIIVEAFTQLGWPLTVIGRGPEHKKLVSSAGPNIVFNNAANDEEVAGAMLHAKAFIFASFEDFGITPVEAMAAGVPVIAFKAGGALDYVKEGETGLFFEEQTASSIVNCLHTFEASHFDRAKIAAFAESFSVSTFQEKVWEVLTENLKP